MFLNVEYFTIIDIQRFSSTWVNTFVLYGCIVLENETCDVMDNIP